MAASAIKSSIGVQQILVATDLSKASDAALHFALDLSRTCHAKCYIFHSVCAMGYTLSGAEVSRLAEEVANRDLRELEADLTRAGDLAGVPHEFIVRQGPIRPEIEALVRERHIDLVVLGTHGRTGMGRLVLGSIAEQIFRAVPCPVLTVGPEARCEHPPRLRRILFPTDLSEASHIAFAKAVEFANQNDAQLVVLHSVTPFPVADPGAAWYVGDDLRARCQTPRASVLQRLEKMVAGAPKLVHRPEYVVEFQYPAEAICIAADAYHADLIVMGVKHASAFRAGHMPWATAHEVVCRATCPVLTVKH
jgi:nucleotide-binding universal stress UspA family protein